MGKRGPAPRGEFKKSTVFSCRLQPDTRKRLDSAKQKSGRSLSQELEHWLRRSFHEADRAVDHYGSEQNAAICKLIGLIIQSTSVVGRDKDRNLVTDPTLWLRDPSVFDANMSGILHLMAWFRPGGSDPRAGIHMTTAATQLLDEIRKADPAVPIGARSTNRESALADLKEELGELAERRPYEKWAEPPVRAVKKNRAFRKNRK